MAVTTNPLTPRKLPPPGAASLDPSQQSPGLAGPDTSPLSPTTPNTNPIPNSATGIAQLPDGAGGNVTVPPTTMAPPSVVPPQPSGPTDTMGRPLSADGTYHPVSGPTFTTTATGQVATTQGANGAWMNADGSPVQQNGSTMAKDLPDWGLPGSGLGTSADPSGKLQAAAGYIPWTPETNGPTATSASSPLAGQLPVAGQARPLGASVANDATASVPGGSTFSADQNLINSQINPAASSRLLKTQGMTDAALQKITQGPDRFKLASDAYNDFATKADRNFAHARTDATNDAAAHGQIGSGMLTNRYGDLQQTLQENDAQARNGFLRDAVEGTIGDNLNNLNAVRTTENGLYTQGANDRGELRNERGYQQSLAEQAIQRRIQQNQMEQGQQQQEFDNGLRLYGAGNAFDPTGAYQNAAGQSSNEAASASGDIGALIRAYLARGGQV